MWLTAQHLTNMVTIKGNAQECVYVCVSPPVAAVCCLSDWPYLSEWPYQALTWLNESAGLCVCEWVNTSSTTHLQAAAWMLSLCVCSDWTKWQSMCVLCMYVRFVCMWGGGLLHKFGWFSLLAGMGTVHVFLWCSDEPSPLKVDQ